MLEHLKKSFHHAPTYVHWLELGQVPTDYGLLLILTNKDITEYETDGTAPYFLQKLTTEECLPSYQLRFNLQPYVKLILPGLPEDACKRLEIIPDAICMQRLKKSSDMGPEYDLPDYSEDKKHRIWLDNVVANRKSNSQTRNSNADAMVTFVLAKYKDPKCLLLFSRAHSVFFVSTEPQYIWMLEDDTQSKSPYVQCVKITKKTFNHDIRSLHPISHDNMLLHLGRKESDLDLCEEVLDWTPFSGKWCVIKGK
ncbi:hypothetical protein ABG067_003710 [Albugo candida]